MSEGLNEDRRNNRRCVKWIATLFCDQYGNPLPDMPLWAHLVTDTLIIGTTPCDEDLARIKAQPIPLPAPTDRAGVGG